MPASQSATVGMSAARSRAARAARAAGAAERAVATGADEPDVDGGAGGAAGGLPVTGIVRVPAPRDATSSTRCHSAALGRSTPITLTPQESRADRGPTSAAAARVMTVWPGRARHAGGAATVRVDSAQDG